MKIVKEDKPSFFYTAHNVLLTPLPFHFYFPPPSPHFYYFPSSSTSSSFLLFCLEKGQKKEVKIPPPHFYYFPSACFK